MDLYKIRISKTKKIEKVILIYRYIFKCKHLSTLIYIYSTLLQWSIQLSCEEYFNI